MGTTFWGFNLRRYMGSKGMTTKVTIPDKAAGKASGNTPSGSGTRQLTMTRIKTKLLAINRIIGGWCRYYQYTSKVAIQFRRMQMEAFWLFAHWLGRKHKLKMSEVIQTFYAELEPRRNPRLSG